MTVSIPVEIQTEHLPNIGLEGIRHTNLIGPVTYLSEHFLLSVGVDLCLNDIHIFALSDLSSYM